MTLKVRRAKKGDTPIILKLLACSLRNLSSEAYSSAQVEAIVRHQSELLKDTIDLGRALIFVGEIDQQLIAAAFVTLDSPPSRWNSSLWIGGVYTHPSFTRQGIARQLLQRVEEEAWQNNVDTFLVHSSFAAISFYQAMGYSCNKRTSFLAGQQSIDCMEMSKFLTGRRLKNYKELLTGVCVAAVFLFVVIMFF